MISFRITESERVHARAIVARAANYGLTDDTLDLEMNLCAIHANGMRLDFERLRAFSRFDFAHDILGIQRHIDRATGTLKGHFLPRCAKTGYMPAGAQLELGLEAPR